MAACWTEGADHCSNDAVATPWPGVVVIIIPPGHRPCVGILCLYVYIYMQVELGPASRATGFVVYAHTRRCETNC